MLPQSEVIEMNEVKIRKNLTREFSHAVLAKVTFGGVHGSDDQFFTR